MLQFPFLPPLVVTLALGLASCSLPLAYAPRPLAADQAQQDFAGRRLSEPALRAFIESADARAPETGQAWSFEALALAAAWFSPDLAVQQSRWQAALDQRALGVRSPGARVDPLIEHHSITDGTRRVPWTLGLGFEFTLPDPERRRAHEAVLDTDLLLARVELAASVWSARQQLRTRWLAARGAVRREQVQQRRLALLTAAEQRVAVRVRHGEQPPQEWMAAGARRQQAELEAADRHRQALAARAALRAALGLPLAGTAIEEPSLPEDRPDSPDALACSLPAGQLPETAEIERAALDNRLDLLAEVLRFERADAALRLEVALQYPELSLQPGYEWDQGDHRLRIGLSLPLALPAAHRAAVGAAVAEREIQARTVLARQQGILQQAAQARQAVEDALERCLDARQVLGQLEQSARAVASAVRHGAQDPLAEIEATLAIEQARQEHDDAAVSLAESRGQLEDVMQQPLDRLFALGTRVAAQRLSAPTGEAR